MAETRLTRKQFVLGLAGGGLAIAVGCGDDETGDATSGSGAGATSGPSSAASSPSDAASTGATTGSGGAGNTGGGGGSTGNGGAGGGSMAGCTMAVTAAISMNHLVPHELVIPVADIDAGVDKIYQTTGPANHCHTVTLTADDFIALKAGMPVTKFSCTFTDHEYVLSCAPGAPQPGAPDCGGTPNQGTCP